MTQSQEMVRPAFDPAHTAFSEIRRVEVDGQVLRVARRRTDVALGVPLLIFNGIGANLELLEPFVEALRGIEIIAFDAPGVGASPSTIVPYRYRHLAHLADRLMKELGYDSKIDVLEFPGVEDWPSNMPFFIQTVAVD